MIIINYANKNNDILERPLAILIIDHHIGVSISLVPSYKVNNLMIFSNFFETI